MRSGTHDAGLSERSVSRTLLLLHEEVRTPRALSSVVAASLVLVAANLTACHAADDFEVRVSHPGPLGSTAIGDLRLFVGANTKSWPGLAAGQSVRVVLNPGGADPRVGVSFSLRGQERLWSGPALDKGVGYAVAIRIGADGQVEEQHCRTPCSPP
jgi:hypothetical protein